MVVLAVGGVSLGLGLAAAAVTSPELWAVVFALLGALMGLVATPFFTTRPARAVRGYIMQMSAAALLAAMTGLVVGLLVAGLLSFPMSLLPKPFGQVLPMVAAVVCPCLGISLFVLPQRAIFSLFL